MTASSNVVLIFMLKFSLDVFIKCHENQFNSTIAHMIHNSTAKKCVSGASEGVPFDSSETSTSCALQDTQMTQSKPSSNIMHQD